MKQRTEQPVADGAPHGSGPTKEQAKAIFQMGEEAVIFALLKQAQMLPCKGIKVASRKKLQENRPKRLNY